MLCSLCPCIVGHPAGGGRPHCVADHLPDRPLRLRGQHRSQRRRSSKFESFILYTRTFWPAWSESRHIDRRIPSVSAFYNWFGSCNSCIPNSLIQIIGFLTSDSLLRITEFRDFLLFGPNPENLNFGQFDSIQRISALVPFYSGLRDS